MPSIVPPKGVLEDIIVPADYIVYNQELGWLENSILPTIVPHKMKSVFLQTVKGKTFRILLPIEIKGIVNEYIFTFEVNDVDIAGPPPKESNFRW